MKKLLIITVACILAHFTSNAQGPRFGISAGPAFANYDIKVEGITATASSKTGIAAGIFVDIPAGSHFSIQPAVNYVQKGTKDSQTEEQTTFTAEIKVNTLEVPVMFLYNSNSPGGNLFLGAGPSFAYSLSGSTKSGDGTTSEKQDIKFGNTADDDMRRGDFGANFLIGYCFKSGLLFSFNYNAGFSNLVPGTSDGSKMTSHYAAIKIGYTFGGSGKK